MASDRTASFRLTMRQLALASALGCALAAAAYTVGTSESPIEPVSVSPPGIATDSARGMGQSGDTHFVADRNWADKLHRAPIEIDSGAIGPGAVPMGQPATASVSPFGVLSTSSQSTAATSTGSTGDMVISPPTISQMPITPPTVGQMPISPPPRGNMPMSPPTAGATVPGIGPGAR